jgi:hypothetical protein
VSPRQLRAFAAFSEDELPPAARFAEELYARLDAMENVFRAFCEAEGAEFVSPTLALRERLAAGEPVYFTYDQHWTRLGHRVVADAVASHLGARDAAAR